MASASVGSQSAQRYLLLFAIAAAFVCSAYTELYAMDTTSIWWHCPHLSSLYMLQDGTAAPVVAWAPDYNTFGTHLLAHPKEPGFGLGPVLALQRPGNTAFLLVPLALMSTGGLILAVFVTDFLILAGSMLLLLRGLQSTNRLSVPLAGLIALLFLLGVRSMASYQVNENCIALGLSIAVLHLLTGHGRTMTSAIAAGLIMAHITGIRPSTILMLAAVIVLLSKPKPTMGFLGALFVGGLVWMTTHAQGLGDPLAHPALTYGYQEQDLLGFTVTFHPFWLPFSELMRPPNHPYPSLIRIPLEVYQAFGALTLGAGFCGLVALRKQRRALAAVALWVLPLLVPLLAIVELDQQKMSYVLLVMAPLPWLAGIGIGELSLGRLGRTALCGFLLLLFIIFPPVLRDLELPIDDRIHGDYRLEGRDLWSELDRKRWLTRARILPAQADHLQLQHAQGLELLSHSTLAHSQATVHEGPITVWAGFPPAGLSHQFKAKTSETPMLQKDFLDISGGSAAGGLPGRVTFLVTLEAPAPTTVNVVLERRKSRYRLSLQSDSDTVTDSTRYLALTIVDRTQEKVGQPTIELDGRRQPLSVVTMGRPDGNEWITEPRFISNTETLTWFSPGPLNSAIPAIESGRARCSSTRFDIRSSGTKLVLTDTVRPVAVTYRSGVGKGRYLSIGKRLATLHGDSDDCVAAFLRIASGGNTAGGAPLPDQAGREAPAN
jgi:hypothetical protein